MATTREEVETTLREVESGRANDTELRRLRDFVEDMRRRGILQQKEYDIPPLDTIGRTAFRVRERRPPPTR